MVLSLSYSILLWATRHSRLKLHSFISIVWEFSLHTSYRGLNEEILVTLQIFWPHFPGIHQVSPELHHFSEGNKGF